MSRERRALLYFAKRARSIGTERWYWRLWSEALELLPYPNDMPGSLYLWAPIAESLALSNFK